MSDRTGKFLGRVAAALIGASVVGGFTVGLAPLSAAATSPSFTCHDGDPDGGMDYYEANSDCDVINNLLKAALVCDVAHSDSPEGYIDTLTIQMGCGWEYFGDYRTSAVCEEQGNYQIAFRRADDKRCLYSPPFGIWRLFTYNPGTPA